jgi:phosphopantothenoylcysteine decarboxylase/phosphopantothenate--cysteine ligase
MHLLITAGPTREPIDRVRFITNASSGRMGYAIAAAASTAGHRVTLLSGPVALDPPGGVDIVPFATVEQLRQALESHFDHADVLIMAAAVGDFTVDNPSSSKLARRDGPITLTLTPTPDLLAGVTARKRDDQIVIAFAVEQGDRQAIEAKARAELAAKHADLVVLNTPAAMNAPASEACILSADQTLLPWAERRKDELAAAIIEQINTLWTQQSNKE